MKGGGAMACAYELVAVEPTQPATSRAWRQGLSAIYTHLHSSTLFAFHKHFCFPDVLILVAGQRLAAAAIAMVLLGCAIRVHPFWLDKPHAKSALRSNIQIQEEIDPEVEAILARGKARVTKPHRISMHQEDMGAAGAQTRRDLEHAKAAVNVPESSQAHSVKAPHSVTAKPGPSHSTGSPRQEQGKGRAGEASANLTSVKGAVKAAAAAPTAGETAHAKQIRMHKKKVKLHKTLSSLMQKARQV
jgi:hypothetical protein